MNYNKSRVLVYTEGGLKLGLGNIYRSLSLVTELQNVRKAEYNIITTSEQYVCEIIQNKGFPVISVKETDLIDNIINYNPSVLLIDYLGISEEFVKKIKERISVKIVIIGNLTKANQFADVVVNAIIGTDFKNRCFVDSFGTLNLFGPKYLVLRKEFEKLRYSYKYNVTIKNIVLLFGGTDQANYTCKILRKLLDSNGLWNIILITGAGYEHQEELDMIIRSTPERTKSFRNINNVSEIYSQADFLITSPGTALFEGLCMGIPSLSFYQNESQKEVFGKFFTTCSYKEDLDLLGYINDIYLNREYFNNQLKSYAIGEGRNEIIDAIINLLN